MYVTGGGAKNDFLLTSPQDLVTWKAVGQGYFTTDSSWGNGAFWAPEV